MGGFEGPSGLGESCGSGLDGGLGGLGGSGCLGNLVGLVGLGCQVGLILGIFLPFNLIQKYFEMEILSLVIQKNMTVP